MKRLVLALFAAVLLLGWTGPSYAGSRGHGGGHHGSRHHGGGHYGGGHYGGGHHGGHHGSHHDYYHYGSLLLHGLSWLPWNYYPSRAPAQAREYVQQTDYWYYCTDPEGYYPYLEDCPTGWLQVVPKSPPR